jgi:hypothetical protein
MLHFEEEEEDKEQKVAATIQTPGLGQRVWNKLADIFGADKRSLAFFRFFISMVVIGDLIDRGQDLRAHYTDWGIFPRWDAIRYTTNEYFYIVHFINGDVPFMALLFILHGLFAFCYAIGWHTKLSGFLTWYMTTSLQGAFTFVGHGGDMLLRFLLFWSLFLPCGEVWSVDAALQTNPSIRSGSTNYRHLSVGTIAYLAQLFLMYQTSYVHKSADEWRVTGTSVYYALNIDYFQTDFARNVLLKFPEVLKYMSILVLKWELWGPLFWIIPIKTHWCRMFACLGFWGLHLGFQSGLRLGLFFWVCMAGPIPLIPSWFWDTLVMPRLRTAERLRFRVFLNPRSYFSDTLGRILIHMCLIPETKVSSVHELFFHDHEIVDDDDVDVESGLYRSHKVTSKMIDMALGYPERFWLATRDTHGSIDYNVHAILAILRHSPLLCRLGNLVSNFPRIIHQPTEKIFTFIHIITMKPDIERNDLPLLKIHPYQRKCRKFWNIASIVIKVNVQIFCLIMLIIVVAWNFQNIGYPSPINQWGWNLMWLTRLDQAWSMFSPHPPKESFWYVIVGQLVNDETVELFRNGALHTFKPNKEVIWSRPENLLASFKNHRWFKVFEIGLNWPNHDYVRQSFGWWLCREYNSRYTGGEQLWKFELNLVREGILLDGKRGNLLRNILWTQTCFDQKPVWKKN